MKIQLTRIDNGDWELELSHTAYGRDYTRTVGPYRNLPGDDQVLQETTSFQDFIEEDILVAAGLREDLVVARDNHHVSHTLVDYAKVPVAQRLKRLLRR